MIIFITSIRHPKNSSSYQNVCQVFERSLRSVCNQIDQNFRVIIVCNKLPVVGFHDERVKYVIVNFDPPSNIKGPKTGLDAVRKDKGCKYVVGLLAAKVYSPDYIMFFDADDYIHETIAGYCNKRPGKNGWYVDRGYVYRDGGILFNNCPDFYKWCGTCNIVSYNLFDLPNNLAVSSSQKEIISSLDKYFLYNILGAHPFTVGYLSKLGTPLEPLPFSAAIYVRGTGENHSALLNTGLPRLIGSKMNSEFGMALDLSFSRQLAGVVVGCPIEFYRIVRYRFIPFVLRWEWLKAPV